MTKTKTAGLTRFYILLGVIAVAGGAAVTYNLVRTGQAASVPLELEELDDPEALVAMARGVTKGDPNASITILEFGDYQCPSCGQFARDYEPGVRLALIETGRAKFIYHDLPIVEAHPHAFLAARAARCAEDQGKYWEYHDELYRQQVRWSAVSAPAGMFVEYAETLGLDTGDFGSCLHSDRHADVVTANLRLGRELGILRTPTLLINVAGRGTAETGWSAEEMLATIEQISSAPVN
jgi:protein-disulfide isomerase